MPVFCTEYNVKLPSEPFRACNRVELLKSFRHEFWLVVPAWESVPVLKRSQKDYSSKKYLEKMRTGNINNPAYFIVSFYDVKRWISLFLVAIFCALCAIFVNFVVILQTLEISVLTT
jgi:hypothetical protein